MLKNLFIKPGNFCIANIYEGQSLKVISTFGNQVVDFWALNAENFNEILSMSHSRSALYKIWFEPNDILVSNHFKPILKVSSDTSQGCHDTLHAACSQGSYKFYGEPAPPSSCDENYNAAMEKIGAKSFATPSPWNLFEHAFVLDDGYLKDKPTTAKPGDYVELEALKNLIIICSACPSKVGSISGFEPQGATLEY